MIASAELPDDITRLLACHAHAMGRRMRAVEERLATLENVALVLDDRVKHVERQLAGEDACGGVVDAFDERLQSLEETRRRLTPVERRLQAIARRVEALE